MNLPVQHLSDEAVAAFADGVLGSGARARAARHVAECAECAHAVAVQREAMWVLRAAPAPALPGDLLDRLRAVPSTTPLSGGPLGGRPVLLDADGSAVFPAFGTPAAADPGDELAPMNGAAPRDGRAHVDPRDQMSGRRARPYGLLTAAAAVIAVGAVGGAIASSTEAGSPAPFAPATTPSRVQTVETDTSELAFPPGSGSTVFARAER